jgi:chromosome segregation ATPase
MNEKIIVHENVKYRMVNKKADVGEMVLVISEGSHDFRRGDVTVIKEIDETDTEQTRRADAECGWLLDSEYLVLEPMESEATPDITDLLANLARRVSSLEHQLRDTQSNVEKLAEELANTKHRVSKHAERVGMLTDDIITLDERSQVLNAINKFYEEGCR